MKPVYHLAVFSSRKRTIFEAMSLNIKQIFCGEIVQYDEKEARKKKVIDTDKCEM